MAEDTAQGQEPVEQAQEGQQQTAEETFSKAQVEEIVRTRLARAKHEPPADYEELKAASQKHEEEMTALKASLDEAKAKAEQAEAQLNALQAAGERQKAVAAAAKAAGVDETLLAAMRGDTPEEIAANVELIKAARPAGARYPQVSDSGEAGRPSAMTREDILSIRNERDRIKAIQENIELFR